MADIDTSVQGIRRVGVVGCGLMGSGIAEICARVGVDVTAVVSSAKSIPVARDRVSHSLHTAQRKGKLGSTPATTVLDAIAFTDRLEDLVDRQMIFECVTEHEPTKQKVFSALDRIVADPDVIFATNTSSFPVMKLATATGRPRQVVGTHFFNPVPVLPLVEVVPSLLTSAATYERTTGFLVDVLGKRVIRSPDRAGFVVNALLVPYLLSAIRMVESGYASAEAIDDGMRLGCAHPMGPLALSDLLGLDTLAAVARGLYEEFKEPLLAPPPLLSRMVDGGLLGRKAGQGFFEYPQ